MAEPSFDHSAFSRNSARLSEHDLAREFFIRMVAEECNLRLLSDEHFTVDGTLYPGIIEVGHMAGGWR